jgi:hypothetical protein
LETKQCISSDPHIKEEILGKLEKISSKLQRKCYIVLY